MILDHLRMTASVGDLTLNILKLKYLEPGSVRFFGSHCHSGYELHFVPQGKGRVTVSEKAYEVVPGTFYLTGPGVYHEQVFDAKDPMAEYCVNFDVAAAKNTHVKSDVCERDMDRIRKALAFSPFWFGRDTSGNIVLLDKIKEEADRKYIGYLANIKRYLEIIILNSVRCVVGSKISSDIPEVKDCNDKRRLITDQYLQENWESPDIRRLAAALAISERQLNRVFTEYYGAPFCRTLSRVRMQMAARHLSEDHLSVKEIAELAGYADTAYFCRLFKRQYGVTATQYRASLSRR